MTWTRIGAVTIGATTTTAYLGKVRAPLIDGFLHLRLSSEAGDTLRPLSFGVVIPETTTGEGAVPAGRYYPQNKPALVPLGPGLGPVFDGVLRFRPRGYNLRWLKVGYPAGSWTVIADAWSPDPAGLPEFTVYGWTDGETLSFTLDSERVGPANAAPLKHG